MNKHKRLLSFALALVLIVGMLPMNALATDTPTHIASCGPDCALVDCDCPCHKLCPECDATMDAEGKTVHDKNCPTLLCTCEPVEGIHISPCVLAPVVQDLAPLCEKCTASYAADGVTIVHEPGCENQQPLCEECTATLGEDGKLIHEEKCPTRCSCTPKATGETPHTNPECPLVEQCEHCHVPLTPGATHLSDCITNCKCDPKPTGEADHTNTQCPFYVAKCEYCKVVLTEDAVHPETCLTHCKCDPKPTGEAAHTNEQCPFYVAKCEYCKVVLTEDAVHLETCLTHCKCEPKPAEDEKHTSKECKFYVPTAFEQLKAAQTLKDMFDTMNKIMEENMEDITALTYDELTELADQADAMYAAIEAPTTDDNDYYDLVTENLNLLRVCPDCDGEMGEHKAGCPRIGGIQTFDSTVSNVSNVTINLFDYGSAILDRDELAVGMSGANGAHLDYHLDGAASADKVVSTTLDLSKNEKLDADRNGIYDGISKGVMAMIPVLDANGYPQKQKKDGGTISLDYLFGKSIPVATKAPYDTEYIKTVGEIQTTNFEAHRYPVTSGSIFKQTSDGYLYYNSRDMHLWYEFEDGDKHTTGTVYITEDYTLNPSANYNGRYSSIGHFLPFNGEIVDYDTESYTVAKAPTDEMALDGDNDKDGIVDDWEPTNGQFTSGLRVDPSNFPPTKADYLYRIHTNLDDLKQKPNMWIGMSAEFNFNQPEDGKKNGQDMVFEFSGDDLMYVYIDNVMILDVSGTGDHSMAAYGLDSRGGGAKTATINFATGEVRVYKVDSSWADIKHLDTDNDGYLSVAEKAVTYDAPNYHKNYDYHVAYDTTLKKLFDAAVAGGYINEAPQYNGDTFADFSTHSFKMFYMDTGHGTSNCYLKFNMDPIPTNDVTLEKVVTGINPALQDDQIYTFTLSAKDGVNVGGTSVSDIAYTIKKGATVVSNGRIGDGEEIGLKAGEKVTLVDVPVTTYVNFTETKDNNIFANTQWKCEGSDYTEGEDVQVPSGSNPVDFVCTNARNVGNLSITKAFDGVLYEPNKEFTMVVTIAGNPYTGTGSNNKAFASDGSITLKNGETVTIEGIPSGMAYTVVENDPNAANGYAYAFDDGTYPKYTNGTGNITVEPTAVTVTNAHVYADLVIDKNITGGEQADENQTFLFTVSGGPAKVNTKVLVKGDGQAKVAHLPVGNGTDASYTITEDTAWSWRYELSMIKADKDSDARKNGNRITIELPAAGEKVTFTNKRVNPYWISGDCHAENAWTDSGDCHAENAWTDSGIDATINGVQRPEEGDDTNA